MKGDPGSSYSITSVIDPVTKDGAATNSSSIDHANAPSVTFLISCGLNATSVDAKVQYSEDDSTFSDGTAATGNDTSITQMVIANQSATLNVPNPQGRYSRVVVTTVDAAVIQATAVAGPLRHVAAT